jgi:hypothetical protein
MKKTCTSCKEEKEINDFYKFNRAKDGRCSICKKCDNNRKTAYLRKKSLELGKTQRNYTLDAKKDRENGIKYCPECKIRKPISEFLYNNAARDKVDFFCIDCKKKLAKRYRQTPEDRRKYYQKRKRDIINSRLLRNFGITLEQYEKKLEEQNGKCEICGLTPIENKKSLAVDHDHNSGRVRGLLCNNCNVAVGFLKDNVDKAKKMTEYITKYITGEK